MPDRDKTYAMAVEAWAAAALPELTVMQQIETFERAFRAIWICAHRTLSEFTLSAVMERAIFESTETHSFLISLEIDETGIRWGAVKRSCLGIFLPTLQEGLKSILSIFISLLGNITNGVLSPELHRTLSAVRYEPRFVVLSGRTGEEE